MVHKPRPLPRAELRIREAVPGDFPKIRALLKQESMLREGFTEQAFMTLLSNEGKGLCFVAVQDAGVVGSIFGWLDNGEGAADGLTVDPQHRGLGIGTALLGALRRKLQKAHRVTSLSVYSQKHNPRFFAAAAKATDGR